MLNSSQEIFEAIWTVVIRRGFDRATAATALFEQMIHAAGEVRRNNDQLLIGDRPLNRDRDLLPQLAHATGLGFALYLGNRRIATATVPNAGTAPGIGGYANSEISDAALRRRETFKGEIQYGDREYLAVARPIYASNESDFAPIGAIEAFQDKQAYFDFLSAAARAGIEEQVADARELADGMESVVTFIDDVARRLQLLALNGNIIASQAGEHGKAFRVVCRELGSLANQAKHTGSEVRKLSASLGIEAEPSGSADTANLNDDTESSSENASGSSETGDIEPHEGLGEDDLGSENERKY